MSTRACPNCGQIEDHAEGCFFPGEGNLLCRVCGQIDEHADGCPGIEDDVIEIAMPAPEAGFVD